MDKFWVTVSIFYRKNYLFSICVDSKVIRDPVPDDFIKEEFHFKFTLNNQKTQVQLWLRGIPLIPQTLGLLWTGRDMWPYLNIPVYRHTKSNERSPNETLRCRSQQFIKKKKNQK